MENFIIIGMCLSAGMLLRRFAVFPEQAPLVLNLYVIWIALPGLILQQVPGLRFSPELLVPVVMPWLMLVVGATLVLVASRIFSWKREVVGVLLLTVPLGNTSFLGIPMIQAFWGEEMVSYGIIYDQFGSFIALSTYGTVVLAVYGHSKRPDWQTIVKKVLTFPPFVVLMIALVGGDYLRLAPLHHAFSILGNSLVPVVMCAIGLQLKIRLAKGHGQPFFFGLAAKLIAAPLIAMAICKVAGLDSQAALVSVFEAGMPPMITAGVLAISAGLAPHLVAALIGWGILAAFVTLPLLSFLLH